jgi:hypothetical protein
LAGHHFSFNVSLAWRKRAFGILGNIARAWRWRGDWLIDRQFESLQW